MNSNLILATKEPAFEFDSGEVRAILYKGHPKSLDALSDGYVYDRSSINTKMFSAYGNLGIIKLEWTESCMGALSLGDEETICMGLDEAKELLNELSEAISDAEDSLCAVFDAEAAAKAAKEAEAAKTAAASNDPLAAFDHTQAHAEGWRFVTEGDIKVERLDCGPIIDGEQTGRPRFNSDDEALGYVKGMATCGSAYHKQVLSLMAQNT